MKILRTPRFPGTGWKPSKLALLETASQRGVEGVCGRRCIFGRTGGASTNCPLPPSLTHLQKGSKFGFFGITYSHLGKYSGKYYNILSRAFLRKSLEFVLPEDPQEPLNHWIINSTEIVSHWKNWLNSTRNGGQIKRSEKQSSCTYRGGCVVHEWLQAVIGRYYRGGRRAVVDQDI